MTHSVYLKQAQLLHRAWLQVQFSMPSHMLASSLAQLILMVHAGKLHLVYGSYSDATASLHRQWPVATRRSELAQVGEEFEEATPRESG